MKPASIIGCRHLDAYYGRLKILRDVDLSIGADETVTLLGANGAGKTTLLKALTGGTRITGTLELDGVETRFGDVSDAARAGIAHVPEGRGTMTPLTVEENLRIGGHLLGKKERQQRMNDIYAQFPRLAERRKQVAGSLSGGEQQMLALGRGLMLNPRVLLLDEPSLGLAPALAAEFFSQLADLQRRTSMSILLVEQNAMLALGVAHRAYVLESGSVIATGSASEIRDRTDVADLYLGGKQR